MSILLVAGLGASGVCTAEQKAKSYEAVFYYAPDQKEMAARFVKQLEKNKSSRSTWRLVLLDEAPTSNAKQQEETSQALLYGVTALPCVLLSYKGLPYARLFQEKITPSMIKLSEQRAEKAPMLIADFEARLASMAYKIGLLLQDQEGKITAKNLMTPEQISLWVKRCRALIDSPDCSVQHEQYLRLRLIYPLLLLEYAQMYKGGHTQATEEKFLEAINELERARDLAPTTSFGRTAYALREELRRARLNAKIYD